jgi:hypothetical protein
METVYVCPLASDDPQPAGPGTERTRSATGRALKPAGKRDLVAVRELALVVLTVGRGAPTR